MISAMTSRKKAKGKARRAAKEAKAKEDDGKKEETTEQVSLEAQLRRLQLDGYASIGNLTHRLSSCGYLSRVRYCICSALLQSAAILSI